MLRVGRITGAHGLKGAIRFRPDNPDSDTLEQVARVFLESAGQAREFRLTGMTRLNATTRRITLEGVADVNAAESLKGALVMLATEDVPATKPGEFYYYEAIGCEVFLTDGSRIGMIEEIFSTGGIDCRHRSISCDQYTVARSHRSFTLPPIEVQILVANE